MSTTFFEANFGKSGSNASASRTRGCWHFLAMNFTAETVSRFRPRPQPTTRVALFFFAKSKISFAAEIVKNSALSENF